MMIECTNIVKSYGALQVLKGVDFSAAPGEVVSIVGASGAGKSTLLQILGTLLVPDSGRVLIEGTDVFSLSQQELSYFRNRRIGFVFQFHHLLPEFTALENVMMPAWIARYGKGKKGGSRELFSGDTAEGKASESSSLPEKEDIRRRACSLLEELGLAERLEHKPSELSGGEQQRVAIARALMNHPAVLFADEPSGNLDSKTREEIHDLFFDLRDRHGQTVVIVTHDKELALRSDRMMEMKDGRFI